MNERDILFAEAKLGVQIREFLNTPVGKYVSGRAEKSREEAFTTWMSCNPQDAETIRELQFRARVPDLVMQWLDQAMSQAIHAEETLREIES